MFGQKTKMFIERWVIEKHLLESKDTLIFRVKPLYSVVKYIECSMVPDLIA